MEVANVLNPKLKVKICVSGAADTSFCGPNAYAEAKELGAEIARQGAVIMTGATTGFPLWAAEGAKTAGGTSVGLSPAATEREHVESYKLPLEYMDFIIYTGFGYSGRDLLLTRSADAVVLGCGRIGTLHEFTIAFEDGKPLGVLEGDWGFDEVIKDVIANAHRPNPNLIFDKDPKKLIERIITMVETRRLEAPHMYASPDVTTGAEKPGADFQIVQ
jgi:uncharacterized protein (TIGR00725 family)